MSGHALRRRDGRAEAATSRHVGDRNPLAVPGAKRTPRGLGLRLLYIAPILSFAVGILVVINGRRLLPARYYFDAQQIQDLASTSHVSVSFASPTFGAIAAIYRIAGLADDPVLAGLVTYAAAALIVLLAFRAHAYRITVMGAIAGSLSLLVASVYLGTYSKDVLSLPIAAVAILARRGWRGHVALVIAILLYATTFRDYWYLTAGLYVVFLAVSALRAPRALLFVLPLIALIVIAVVGGLVFGIDSDFARTTVNTLREGTPDARTEIVPFVTLPGVLSPLVNTCITFLTLLLPLPLLAMGSRITSGPRSRCPRCGPHSASGRGGPSPEISGGVACCSFSPSSPRRHCSSRITDRSYGTRRP